MTELARFTRSLIMYCFSNLPLVLCVLCFSWSKGCASKKRKFKITTILHVHRKLIRMLVCMLYMYIMYGSHNVCKCCGVVWDGLAGKGLPD